MAWPFKDYDYYGERYVNIKDPNAECGERMWYDRENIHDGKIPTECILCIEAETEMYTKYAHPKAHANASAEAAVKAEGLAIKEKTTEDYLDYYTFHYRREYIKIYKELYKHYKEEYRKILLSGVGPDDKLCQSHLESFCYNREQTNSDIDKK
jgi:hypothetical protein